MNSNGLWILGQISYELFHKFLRQFKYSYKNCTLIFYCENHIEYAYMHIFLKIWKESVVIFL